MNLSKQVGFFSRPGILNPRNVARQVAKLMRVFAHSSTVWSWAATLKSQKGEVPRIATKILPWTKAEKETEMGPSLQKAEYSEKDFRTRVSCSETSQYTPTIFLSTEYNFKHFDLYLEYVPITY